MKNVPTWQLGISVSKDCCRIQSLEGSPSEKSPLHSSQKLSLMFLFCFALFDCFIFEEVTYSQNENANEVKIPENLSSFLDGFLVAISRDVLSRLWMWAYADGRGKP